ncbi:MAG TPA: EVE domain-containing protein [Polyangiaceae bacterium]|nr:EVE domain-containing protein [Polyangiaceae bacterium]
MSRWLIKSEPHVYPFSQLEKDKKTSWTGVRNFEARNNLRAMKKGDVALFYHSNEGKEIVGIAKIVRGGYADPTDEAWSTVDVAPMKALKEPVTLAAVKGSAKLQEMALVKKSRVSVVPVTEAEFLDVLKMGKTTHE